ncbi:MAG: DUF7665 family protein [Gemmatimonadaceae bacterium]
MPLPSSASGESVTSLPDERAFRLHVGGGAFLRGVVRGRWRLLSIAWPYALIAVRAADREHGPRELVLRFELSNYPNTTPTAAPWDAERNAPLDPARWPTGRSRVAAAFNPGWNSQALYLPCDRRAIAGHDAWRTQHPAMIWSPSGDITQYLRIVHELLNSSDYTGPRSIPARA